MAVEDIVETFYQIDRSVEQVAEDYNLTVEQVGEALRYEKQQGKPLEA